MAEQEKYTREEFIKGLKDEGVPQDMHEKYLDVAREKGVIEEEEEEEDKNKDNPEPESEEEDSHHTQEEEEPSGDVPPKEDEEGSDDEEEDEEEEKEKKEQKSVPLQALKEERRKRQERDKQLQELQKQMIQLQMQMQQNQQQNQQVKTEDQNKEEEEEEDLDPLQVMIRQEIQKSVEPIKQRTEFREKQEQLTTFVEQREREARAKYGNEHYEEITKPVIQYADAQARQGDPSVLNMIMSSPNPAEMTYIIGSAYKYQQLQGQQQEEQETQRKQKVQKDNEKVKNMDNLPRGDGINRGSPGKGKKLSLSNYSNWPEELKQRALKDGEIPGYEIVP